MTKTACTTRVTDIQPDTQKMRLTRVSAAHVRAVERSQRDARGGVTLQGAIFQREGKQWMVTDVARLLRRKKEHGWT